MANKAKIKQLIERLSKYEKSLPTNEEMRSLADSVLNEQFSFIAEKAKSSSIVKSIDKLNAKLVELKEAMNISSLDEPISQLEQDIFSLRQKLFSDIDAINSNLLQKNEEVDALIKDVRNNLDTLTQVEIKNILNKIVEIEDVLTSQSEAKIVVEDNFKEAMHTLEQRFKVIDEAISLNNTNTETTTSTLQALLNTNSSTIKSVEASINKLRQEFNTRLANVGGGNANRQININSSVMSSKFTDINFKAGSNVTLSKSDNITTSQVDITIAATGGGGGITSVVAGTGITVDNTTPSTPIVNLGNTSVVTGTYGSATTVPRITVDQQGRLSAASTVGITFPSAVTSVLAGTGIVTDSSLTPTVTLGNTSVVAGTYGSDVLVPQVTIDAQGRISSASNVGITPSPSTVAGGSDTQIQFNNGGTLFGGSSRLTWNNTTSVLNVASASSSVLTVDTVSSVTAYIGNVIIRKAEGIPSNNLRSPAALDVRDSGTVIVRLINTGTNNGSGGAGIISYTGGTNNVFANHRLGFLIFGGIASVAGTEITANSVSIQANAEENWGFGSVAGANLQFHTTNLGTTARTEKMRITGLGNIVLGSIATAIPTSATDGFVYLPTATSSVTATPTTQTAKVAMYYDTTGNKLYIYNGAWKSVALT